LVSNTTMERAQMQHPVIELQQHNSRHVPTQEACCWIQECHGHNPGIFVASHYHIQE
jgi:hypothetical protein